MWQLRGFSISILMKGNQGAFQPRNRSYGDQGAFQPRSWWKVTKGLFNLDLEEKEPRGFSTLELEMWWPRGFSTSELELWQPRGFSTLKWAMETKGTFNLDVDEREPIGFSTSELELWRPRGFSTSILKKGNQVTFQPWNQNCGDQGAFQPRSELLPAKSQNLGLHFIWWRLCGTIVLRCVISICSFFIWIFSLAWKPWQIFVVPWKRFFFPWNLKLRV